MTHSMDRVQFVRILLYGFTVSVMLSTSALAQIKQGYLSDDGQVVTVGKVPNALQMASFDNHLGLVKSGVKVEIYESKRDPVVPATWVKVKILEGEYRGKSGWALSQTVHEVKISEGGDSSVERESSARSSRGNSPSMPSSQVTLNEESGPEQASHRTVVASPLFSSPNELNVRDQSVEVGTWVQHLETQKGFTSFQFLKVRVLSGAQKDHVAWIPSHVLKAKVKIISTIIANPNDPKSWPVCQKLANRDDIELLSIHLFDQLVNDFPDLSQRKEIVLFDHGGENETWTNVIMTGDTPRTLAEKFRAAGVTKANGQTVELIVCTAGQWKQFQGRRYNYAIELAKELGMPVIAYPHYNRVEVGEFLGICCSGATVRGYRYKTDVFTDKKEKVLFDPPERTEYFPSGHERLLQERLP